ncbi:unnamed protein product [Ectocarpus sp. 6 AP-2014]
MGDAAIEPSSVGVPALHAGDDLGKITKDLTKTQKDIASGISSTASAASDGTKTGQEEAVAGRGEDTPDIPFKAVPLGLPRSTSLVTQPDSPALGGAKTLVAVDAETPPRRQLLRELLPRPTATATDRDGRVGEQEVDGLLSSPAGVADGGGGTADAGAVVSDSETAAADATPVDASLMPPRHLSNSWSEISLHLDDKDEGGRKEATTAKDGESNSPVRTLSSATPSLWDVRGKSSSSKAFGSNRSATTNLEVSDLFEKIRNATKGCYASGPDLFGGRGKAAAVSDVSLSSDDEIASEKGPSTREYFEAMGSSPARRLPGLAPFRSGIGSGNGKNGSGADDDDGFPAAEELDGDVDRGGLAGALRRRGILEQSPLMSPPHPPPFRQSSEASSATVSPMVSVAARARLEAEVDMEEGFVWATSPPAATAVVAGAADTGAGQVVAGADGQSLVLPYLGVAIWGKDFKPEVHAEVLKASEEKGYRRSVDVFLPVCKEPLRLLANTWKYVAALDYPDFKVFVLDDGASEGVQALASTFGFEYVLRADVPALKKAGNLRNAFARTSGEAIAIFDADYCPRLVRPFSNRLYVPTIGIVQTPQFCRHRKEQTWVEQGAGVSQEFFYRMVQMNQDRFNAAVCVGSCGLYRRAALEPLGGMAAIEHSEDMYTGYKMTENGFKIKYVPLALAMGTCPDEPQSFMQQYRWCKGSATLVREKEFWTSNISKHHKLCFLNGLLHYMGTTLLLFVAPLPIMLLVWVEADGVLWHHSGFMLPSLLFAGIVLPLWSKQHYGMPSYRIKIIQYYAHLFAIKDSLLGVSAPWVPSGVSSSSSSRYKSSVRLMVAWSILSTVLIIGGCAWRMTTMTWYHFVPSMAFAVGSFILNMSTLMH